MVQQIWDTLLQTVFTSAN